MRMTGLFTPSSFTRFSARCTTLLVVACASFCLLGHFLEDSELSEKRSSSQDPSLSDRQQCSSQQQCVSTQQPQDDTTVLLQGGRIKVERLSEYDFQEQIHQDEATLTVPKSKSAAHQTSASSQDHDRVLAGNSTAFVGMSNSFLSFISELRSHAMRGRGVIGERITGAGHIGLVLLGSMVFCTCLAAIGLFLPALLEPNDEKMSYRTNDMMKHGPPVVDSRTGSRQYISAGGPGAPTPMMPQQSPAMQPVGRPPATYTRGGTGSPAYPQRFGGSQAEPSRLSQIFLGSQPTAPSGAFLPSQSPLPSLTAMTPKAPADEEPPLVLSKRMPPPLCPTLVLPVCEARFGVPMFEIAQLVTEGELGIVGLSGNPLLRAAVRKVGRRRSLEISMPEAGSAPRATIGPNLQDLNKPDDGTLEIRGLKGSFYGLLEMRPSGACFVTKDGETMMIIDGDTESLQLAIKSGTGLPLASVRCSTEPFGGVDHVEIRVEPGVDTVLVLACVLAVLLLSPTS